ncbi:hypothetical protein GCM10022232_57660 [Streptomyces plumbiresistens]|uniref:Uncharacterized protein n=1 Tax=Streptomyces plumbiresistens TaxID=511811 RepID=A0ABP7SB68_9ACTN
MVRIDSESNGVAISVMAGRLKEQVPAMLDDSLQKLDALLA